MNAILALRAGVVLAAVLGMAGLGYGQVADLVVINAIIYTGDPEMPLARQMAVKAGRIMVLGDDLSVHVGPETRKLDAKGGTVIPGFIDSHGHVAGLGQSLETIDLREAVSAQHAVEMVKKAAAGRRTGEWILGRGWDQTRWPGSQFPTAAALAIETHPVFLTRVDGHAAWVNQRALDEAGIGRDTKDPQGGKIHRDASGRATGILVDRAMSLVTARIPAPTPAQLEARIGRAALECAKYGITTVHDAGVGAEDLEAYRALIKSSRLPVRVYAMIRGEGDLWEQYLRRGPEIGERLTVRSIKLVADGALGSRGAALAEPYSDDPGNRGLLILSREQIARVARAAAAHGFQVNTHAIGDLANRTVLDAYASVLGGKNDLRFRIEHAQIVAPGDIALFAKYGVIASMQSTHATSDMRWAEQRVGKGRLAGAYAWRSFLDAGVPVANGSDFPVEAVNPLLGFHAAITRQDRRGFPAGGWMPGQAMTREEALRSFTAAGAFAAFEEKDKGSLTPGKLADFVVLSKDIMRIPAAEIPSVYAISTVVGGEIVYTRLHDGPVQLNRSQSKFLRFGDLERPSTLVTKYRVSAGQSTMRLVLMSAPDLDRAQKQEATRWLEATEYGSEGELQYHLRRPGDYALVLDQRPESESKSVTVDLDIGVFYDQQATFEPKLVPAAKRTWVMLGSACFFLLVGGVSGWRVLRAFRRRPPAVETW
ncbi:MAG: amidohydrolase [Bryobacteraceae bacterium]